MIYLDNSATTYPKPKEVRQAVSSAIQRFGANPGRGGHKMARETDEAVYRVRSKLARFFGSKAENVIFFGSCTAAINQVLFGKLKKGDHVVVSDLEHNAVIRPLEALKSRGVEYSVAETFPEDNDRTVLSFRSSIKENTKLIVATAASNVWGVRLPIGRLAALAHVYGAEICVDAAQASGLVPIDVNADRIDYLCFPAHKGLYGIMGLGVLITDKGADLEPLIYGGTGVNSLSPHQPERAPERFESGTLNVPAIAALGAGVDFVSRSGVDNIRRKELKLLSGLQNTLRHIPWLELYTGDLKDPYYVPVLSFTAGERTGDLAEYLTKNGIALRDGFHCAPSAHRKMGTERGAIRISPSGFTRTEEIGQFVQMLKRFR